MWTPFRDVFEVDHIPIRDRDAAAGEAVSQREAGCVRSEEQAKAIAEESGRYNLGAVQRTINNPVFALIILQPDVRPRFKFTRRQAGSRSSATDVRVVDYVEEARPTVIAGRPGEDMPAFGRFWIESATGRVVKAEVRVEVRDVKANLTTTFRSDERLGHRRAERVPRGIRPARQPRVRRRELRAVPQVRSEIERRAGAAARARSRRGEAAVKRACSLRSCSCVRRRLPADTPPPQMMLKYPTPRKDAHVDDYRRHEGRRPVPLDGVARREGDRRLGRGRATPSPSRISQSLPLRDHFKKRLTELWNYPRTGIPTRRRRTHLLRAQHRTAETGAGLHARRRRRRAVARHRSERDLRRRIAVAVGVAAVA